MLSFGSAAYTGRKEMIGTFSANLETLPGATADPKTAQWWAKHSDAWAACRQSLETPETAMRRYVTWLKALPGKPVFEPRSVYDILAAAVVHGMKVSP